MKFFEGLKKNANKAIIGSTIIASSLSSIESNAQETKNDINPDKTEFNSTVTKEPSMDPEFYINKYIKYMEHPFFLQQPK